MRIDKILIVATVGLEHTALTASRLHHLASQQNVEIVVVNEDHEKLKEFVNNIEAKNLVNSKFQPEPITIFNYHHEHFEPKINDIPRNKFIDKPRYNFKKK